MMERIFFFFKSALVFKCSPIQFDIKAPLNNYVWALLYMAEWLPQHVRTSPTTQLPSLPFDGNKKSRTQQTTHNIIFRVVIGPANIYQMMLSRTRNWCSMNEWMCVVQHAGEQHVHILVNLFFDSMYIYWTQLWYSGNSMCGSWLCTHISNSCL